MAPLRKLLFLRDVCTVKLFVFFNAIIHDNLTTYVPICSYVASGKYTDQSLLTRQYVYNLLLNNY